MKIALAICLAVLLLIACSRAGNAQPAEVERGGLLIDVRSPGEYNGGHLANAILISYTDIAGKIAQHVKGKSDRIVLYCHSGSRAGIAKRTLEKLGYTAVVNAGSYGKLKTAEEKRAEK